MKIAWRPPPTKEQLNQEKTPVADQNQATPRDVLATARNNLNSDLLRCEINKLIAAGAPLEDVCLKLLECITAMTCDTAFYIQNSQRIQGRE